MGDGGIRAAAVGAALLVAMSMGACGQAEVPVGPLDSPTAPVVATPSGSQTTPEPAAIESPDSPSASFAASGPSCGNIAPARCNEQGALIAARHPGVVAIDIQCTPGVTCDRTHGTGTALVTLADGTTLTDVFSYVAQPQAAFAERCTEVPSGTCRKLIDDAVATAESGRQVVSVAVSCRTGPCTTDSGEADVIVTFEGGTTEHGVSGWSAPLP